MRTIVINTCQIEQNLRLDLLFRVPFSEEQLLWINTSLSSVETCVERIKNKVLKEAHIVDKRFNLIIISELSSFPYGRYQSYVDVYKRLLLLFFMHKLLKPLYNDNSFAVNEVMVLTITNADKDMPFSFNTAEDWNAEEERTREPVIPDTMPIPGEAASDSERMIDYSGGSADPLFSYRNNPRLNPLFSEQKILAEIFSWKQHMKANDINWALPINNEGESLDFQDIFPDLKISCDNSKDTDDLLAILVDEFCKSISKDRIGQMSEPVVLDELKADSNVSLDTVGIYFSALERVFRCVESGTLNRTVEDSSLERIKKLLEKAYAKYAYFSDENNIPVHFEKLESEHDEDRLEQFAELKIKLPENSAISDPLIKRVFDEVPEGAAEDKRLTEGSLDERFSRCAQIIAKQYGRECIEKQNTEVLMLCMNQYLAWRDQKTAGGLKKALDDASENRPDDQDCRTDSLANIKSDYELLEKKYEELRKKDIEDIADVKSDPADYDNVSHEAEELCAKYDHLRKKGKLYRLATVGGAICVALLFLSYLIYGGFSGWIMLVKLPLYAGTLCAFAAAYFCSFSFYMQKNRAERMELFNELLKLKARGEERRLKSLGKLKEYYETVMPRAETHTLWWTVVREKYLRSFILGSLKSEHVKLFNDLRLATLGFATKLKIGINVNTTYKPDRKDFNVEKSYFEEPNQYYYSFFDIESTNDKPKNEEAHV